MHFAPSHCDLLENKEEDELERGMEDQEAAYLDHLWQRELSDASDEDGEEDEEEHEPAAAEFTTYSQSQLNQQKAARIKIPTEYGRTYGTNKRGAPKNRT